MSTQPLTDGALVDRKFSWKKFSIAEEKKFYKKILIKIFVHFFRHFFSKKIF